MKDRRAIDSGGIPFASYPLFRSQPCPECGASLGTGEAASHLCEIARFDAQFTAWLASPHGRFAAWLAERTR